MHFDRAVTRSRFRSIAAIAAGFFIISTSSMASAAPARPSASYVKTSAVRDKVVYRAAITMEAEARSQDATVRTLRGKVNALTQQLNAGKGDLARIRRDLAAAESEMVRRLADSDAAFAVERARFTASIGALFEQKDPVILDLLRRYGEGDSKALAELQKRIELSDATPMQRLIDQHAFATLVVDAAAKKERSEADAIAAYEAVLRINPNDYLALSQLPGLYLLAGQPQRARPILDKLEQIEARYDFASAPQAKASLLHQRAVAASQEGNLAAASQFARQSIAIYREYLAMPYKTWRMLHPKATEPAWMIEQGGREWLAIPLHTLALIEQQRGNYAEAEEAARESFNQRRLIAADQARGNGKPSAVNSASAAGSALTLGRILLAAGDPLGAMSAFQGALESTLLEQKISAATSQEGQVAPEPYWVLIPYAKAAILAGKTDEAASALDRARAGIQMAEPTPYSIGYEGLYWLETGNMLTARGQAAEAGKALQSAQQSLAQAVTVDRGNSEWKAALEELNAKLAAAPR